MKKQDNRGRKRQEGKEKRGEREKRYYRENADRLGWGFKTASICPERGELVLAHLKGKRILDLGCGSGIWTDFIGKNGYQVTGADWVKEFIDEAKKKYRGEFIFAQAEKLPFEKNHFDTVLLQNILEHVDDDLLVLRQAARVGKRVVATVPQPTPAKLVEKGIAYKHCLDQSHQRNYTKKSLKKLFKKAGLRIVKTKEIERLPAISLFNLLFRGSFWLKRIVTRLFFLVFREENYYLELLIVAEK